MGLLPFGESTPKKKLIPAGGTTNQSLVKNSNSNYDTKWMTISGTGGPETDPVFNAWLLTNPLSGYLTTISGLNHASLNNLNYASSGHTGFQPAGSYLTTISGLNISLLNNDIPYLTTADSVHRGDILYGNATPAWARLPFPASPTGKVIQATATDVAWSTNPLTIGTSASVSGSNTGDQIVPSTESGASHNFLTAYDAGTGAFSKAQPSTSDISGLGSIATQNASSVSITGGSISALSGFSINDANGGVGNYTVTIAPISSTTLNANRTLTIDMVNAASTIKLGYNLTLSAAATIGGTNTGDVSLPTNHGLSLTNQVIGMGTPSTCTASTTNAVTTTTHTHAITGFLSSVTAHNLLSATHGDTTAASEADGHFILGVSSAWASSGWTMPSASPTTGQVLGYSGANAATWVAGLTNPMTTEGDLLIGGTSGAPKRLADVAVNQVLVSGGAGADPAWSGTPTFAGLTLTGALARGANAITGSGDLGATGTYIGNAYITRHYLSSNVYLDGGTANRADLTSGAGLLIANGANWGWVGHDGTNAFFRSSTSTFNLLAAGGGFLLGVGSAGAITSVKAVTHQIGNLQISDDGTYVTTQRVA